MSQPLSHIRVLDLTRVLAGPWAAQNLADLGAEVIKVERPGGGDDTRSWGPPWRRDGEGEEIRDSAYFLSVNRGKKSVTLDISRPEGQRIARALAEKSDVLIENYKVGALSRYGLGYEDIRASHPGIIYCSVTGYGQDGPLASRPGYDFVFQGMGGLMSITGERDDRPGGGPMKVSIAVTDVLTGMYASLAITAALAHRQSSGVGQHIDMALLDTIVAFGANQILSYWCSDKVPVRVGNAHPNIVPYEAFPARDGHIILAVGNDAQFAAFCKVAGRPDLAADPRFRANSDRVMNRAILVPTVREIMATRTKQQWTDALEAAGVPCGPINNYAEVFENEQVLHRGLRVDIPHALGSVPTVASPMRFSETPVEYKLPPPRLGEHTRKVLSEVLAMKDSELDALSSQGVI
ncbi:MAG: CoA-transferase [Betaproteobacteria bacterium RIFCSPLOWO2_12_FULL_63_13]|nr:MAG: CoA-transferase [Betaproteobacteria bacterium RIFCSPLOWO2_12_FULL_63_13]